MSEWQIACPISVRLTDGFGSLPDAYSTSANVYFRFPCANVLRPGY